MCTLSVLACRCVSAIVVVQLNYVEALHKHNKKQFEAKQNGKIPKKVNFKRTKPKGQNIFTFVNTRSTYLHT